MIIPAPIAFAIVRVVTIGCDDTLPSSSADLTNRCQSRVHQNHLSVVSTATCPAVTQCWLVTSV